MAEKANFSLFGCMIQRITIIEAPPPPFLPDILVFDKMSAVTAVLL